MTDVTHVVNVIDYVCVRTGVVSVGLTDAQWELIALLVEPRPGGSPLASAVPHGSWTRSCI